jgi:putative resolvase
MSRLSKHYRVAEAAALLQVAPVTVRRYTDTGKLSCSHNPGGQRVFTIEQLGVVRPELLVQASSVTNKVVYYLRASDGSQVLLDTQLAALQKAFGGSPDYVIQDKASGLNEKRAGLKRILRLAEKRAISRVYVTEKDRLTRFGFEYLERLLKVHEVEIVVLGSSKVKTPHEELIQDFLSLLASFSGKYYRLRGHQQKKDFLKVAEQGLP